MINKKTISLALIPLLYLLLLLFEKDLAMETDLGRHLKLGEIIVHCLCVPQTNLFSYTNPNFPIINHEWLAEVFFYITSLLFGLNGLIILKIILVITAASLLYITALKKGSQFWITVFSLIEITIFSYRFFVLPELFSYLFIGLFIFLIERYKQTKRVYLLWLLPFLEIMWVNMHIYFIVGIGIYGFFLLEDVIKQKKLDLKLLLIGLTVVLSTLVNPSFIRGALLPFTFSQNYNINVEENESPYIILNSTSTNTNTAYTLVLQVWTFEVLVVLFAICFFVKKLWREPFQLGNGLMAAILSMKYARCLPLFGLLSFIPFVQAFTQLEIKLKDSIDKPMKNILKGLVFIIVCIIVTIHIKGLFDYQIFYFGFKPSSENAVAFMKQAHVHGRIFNDYIIGNYLIYGLYPQEQVYVDARPEAYPASFFNDYRRMFTDSQFFNEQVNKYDINAVVLNVAADDPAIIRPFLIPLIHSKDWIPVYGDGTVTILVRNNKVNKDVINRYRIPISGNQ